MRATRARIHAKIQVTSRTCELHLVAWASETAARRRERERGRRRKSIVNFRLIFKFRNGELRACHARSPKKGKGKAEKGKKGREERKKGGDRRGAHSCSLILIHINPWRPVARLRTRAHLSEERAAESALSQPSDDDSAAFLSRERRREFVVAFSGFFNRLVKARPEREESASFDSKKRENGVELGMYGKSARVMMSR